MPGFVLLLIFLAQYVGAQSLDTGADRIGLSAENLLSIDETRALFTQPSSGYDGASCATNGAVKSAVTSGWTRSELTTLVETCPLSIYEIHRDGAEYYLIGRMQGADGTATYVASFDTVTINPIAKIDAFNVESSDLLDSSLTSLFWADQNQLRKIDKDGLGLGILDQANNSIEAIDYYDGFIYYTVYPGSEEGSIRRVRADGQGLPEIVAESVIPGVVFDLEINASGIYVHGFDGGATGGDFIARFPHNANAREILAARNIRANGETYIPNSMVLVNNLLLYSEINTDSTSTAGTNVWLIDTNTLSQEQVGSYLGSENAQVEYIIGENFYWSAVIEFGSSRATAVYIDDLPAELSLTEQGNNGGCFIATAAYGSYLHSHVKTLRDFRDNVLLTNSTGKLLVDFYYKHSPAIAKGIEKSATLKSVVRILLFPVVLSITYSNYALLFFLLLVIALLAKIQTARKRQIH